VSSSGSVPGRLVSAWQRCAIEIALDTRHRSSGPVPLESRGPRSVSRNLIGTRRSRLAEGGLLFAGSRRLRCAIGSVKMQRVWRPSQRAIAPLVTGGTPGRLFCVFAFCGGKFSCCKGSWTVARARFLQMQRFQTVSSSLSSA